MLDSGLWVAGLGALLIGAAFAGALSRRVGIPAVVAYLIVGVAVGPFTPGYIADPSHIALLDIMGSTLLLFVLGLAIDVGAILRQPGWHLAAPLLYHALATLLGSLVLSAFGVAPLAAATIALAIAVSSNVVVEELALARGHRQGDGARTLYHVRLWSGLSALVGVLSAIVLTTLLAVGPLDQARLIAGFIALGILLLLGSSMGLIDQVAGGDRGTQVLLQFAVVATLVGAAALLLGVAVPLAAYVVGVIVGGSSILAPERRRAQFRGIFALMFFVAAGTLLDPVAVSRNILWLGLVTLLIAGKVFLAFALVRLYRLRLDLGSLAAALGPVGEFGVLFVGIGVSAGVVGQDERSVLLTCAALSIGLFGYIKRPTAYRADAARR